MEVFDHHRDLSCCVDAPEFVFFIGAGPQVAVLVEGQSIRTPARVHECGELSVRGPFENAIVWLVSEEDVALGVARGAFRETKIRCELLQRSTGGDDLAFGGAQLGDREERHQQTEGVSHKLRSESGPSSEKQVRSEAPEHGRLARRNFESSTGRLCWRTANPLAGARSLPLWRAEVRVPSGDEFSLRLHQVSQQCSDRDHACYSGPLRGAPQCFVMHQALPDLHDKQITVLDFPQLPRFQFVAAFDGFGLHIR